MPIIVRAFPLKTSRDEAEAFANELAGPRKEDAANFYRGFGVRHESWHVQAGVVRRVPPAASRTA